VYSHVDMGTRHGVTGSKMGVWECIEVARGLGVRHSGWDSGHVLEERRIWLW
jgi:hypothetical protein